MLPSEGNVGKIGVLIQVLGHVGLDEAWTHCIDTNSTTFRKFVIEVKHSYAYLRIPLPWPSSCQSHRPRYCFISLLN